MPGSSRAIKGLTIAGVVGFFLLVLLNGSPPSGSVARAQSATSVPTPTVDPAKLKDQFHNIGNIISVSLPDQMTTQLSTGLGALAKSGLTSGESSTFESVLDKDHGVYYLPPNNKDPVGSIVVPLKDTLHADLNRSDTRTADGPGKIIGGVWLSNVKNVTSAAILVYVPAKNELLLFDQNGGLVSPDPNLVPELRCLSQSVNDCKPTPSGKGATKAPVQIPDKYDAGAIMSRQETCFTVGLNQVCYLFQFPNVYSDSVAKSVETLLSSPKLATSKLSVSQFDTANAIPDLFGDGQRDTCSKGEKQATPEPAATKAESAATEPTSAAKMTDYKLGDPVPDVCQPSVILIAANQPTEVPGFPGKLLVGIYVALKTEYTKDGARVDTTGNPDGQVFSSDGMLTKQPLPAGDYLMFNAQPGGAIGDVVPVMLVDANANAYFIPGYRLNAFGLTDPPSPRTQWQAFIKDSGAGGLGYP